MRLQYWCITVVNTTAFNHFCATCTGCASLNASSFVWPFLCSAVATRLHRTTWRETYSWQTRTTRGDDCDRRQLRSCRQPPKGEKTRPDPGYARMQNMAWIGPRVAEKSLTEQTNKQTNKCVSRTDTNPPFPFDIAFLGLGFTGFLQGVQGRLKRYVRCLYRYF